MKWDDEWFIVDALSPIAGAECDGVWASVRDRVVTLRVDAEAWNPAEPAEAGWATYNIQLDWGAGEVRIESLAGTVLGREAFTFLPAPDMPALAALITNLERTKAPRVRFRQPDTTPAVR